MRSQQATVRQPQNSQIQIKDLEHGDFLESGVPSGGPYNEDYSILVSILESSYFRETTVSFQGHTCYVMGTLLSCLPKYTPKKYAKWLWKSRLGSFESRRTLQ